MFQEMLEWDMGSYCDNSVVVPDNAISSSSNCFYIIWLRLFNVYERKGKCNSIINFSMPCVIEHVLSILV